MSAEIIGKIRRGLRKPPRYIAYRVYAEARAQAERVLAPARVRGLSAERLLSLGRDTNIDSMWQRLAAQPFLCPTNAVDPEQYDHLCAGDRDRTITSAERALRGEVDLLGSGPVSLGQGPDWSKDYKTGIRWPAAYMRDIEYNNFDQPSDVKFPWELSRMQWLIPAGQAYRLTGDERFAEGVRELIDHWISENPYAHTVNWACTMEPALRIFTWTWFFHVFASSAAWSDPAFRLRFLRALFLHVDFTERHIERSDVNGNHYTADAAALVIGGLFFAKGTAPERWASTGWEILTAEISRQVHPDGVDFECSTSYHRLVFELFFLAALYRKRLGKAVPHPYRDRLAAMASFTRAYSRPDGTTPLWGDADDARALPMGGQHLNDHRYIIGLVGQTFAPELLPYFSGPRGEILWLLGADAAASLPGASRGPGSQAFPNGGIFVMRNTVDHIFIDCGSVGLAGRGGHGHNDVLSFEAVLNGVHLVSDCGSFVYTASPKERNSFRSTAYHNTPKIAGQEINRFHGPLALWTLHNDATPEVLEWRSRPTHDVFRGAHTGYLRLQSPVRPIRTIQLDHATHQLSITDEIDAPTDYPVEIPLHLAPGVEPTLRDQTIELSAGKRRFVVTWEHAKDWTVTRTRARVSPSYGVAVPIWRICWTRKNGIKELSVAIRECQA